MSTRTEEFDVVVVGAGSSGATLAARLSESPERRVLVVERGPAPAPGDWPRKVLDPDLLPGRDDSWVERTPHAVGRSGRTVDLLAGRILGGSSAVNGAYFVRPTRADLDGWAALGNDQWSHDRVLPSMRRLESDRELGDGALHGRTGPVPVTRAAAPIHPVTDAFFAACSAGGHREQVDLNGGGGVGWGMVPRNIDERGRVSTAHAYLDPRSRPRGLSVRGGCEVHRVVIERGRAVGVEVRGPDGSASLLRAGTVVLSAGALGSPALLRRSGVGPAAQLQASGVPVVIDLAGLAANGANHAAIDLHYEPVGAIDVTGGPLLQGALHLELRPGVTVEVMATCRSYGAATGDDPLDPTLSLRVSPMADGAEHLRDAVRVVVELAHSPSFSPVVARWLGPDRATCASDQALDAWIDEHVGTSMHLCATAPMGPAADRAAVVDQDGSVHGIDGLRVVDASIIPVAPTRGPACTAVVLAEHLARTF